MKATCQPPVALMLTALLASAALGSNTINGETTDTPIDALKRLYLVCERASKNGTLTDKGVAYCSIVYQKLTQRAFDGNFKKLSAWEKEQPSLQNGGRR